ncbi:MAG TPA: DUF4388 domain-containing protein [Nitrospirota bacterium]
MAGEKILDIDDSPTVQRLIEMILSSQGYQVVLAADGEEGIAKARSERPAVILVDFVMPKMNGFQVCKILKDDPEFRDTPIILVTSKGDKVGSKFVDVLGITEYFTKPFQPEELLAKIREVIDKGKQPPPSPAMGLKTEIRPPEPPPPPQAARPREGGLEATVRSLVGQALDDFVRSVLPGIIRQEMVRAQHGAETSAGIQGNLATVRIVEVMQMLGLQRQTGRLTIKRGEDGVEVYFKDGAVILASGNGNGGASAVEVLLKRSCRLGDESLRQVLRIAGMTSQPIDCVLAQEKLLDQRTFAECVRRHTESAVYKTMAWKDGRFFFEKVAPPAFAGAAPLKVDELLLEGARRVDEWTLIQQKIPDLSVVFEPLLGNAEELAARGMSEIDAKVFSLINGRRTIQEIIDLLALGEFDVVKSVFILYSVNLIRRKR